jgi:PAS domain S-box-containing protein
MLLVPITTVGEEIVGVISADKDGLDGFDKHDQPLLETLARQAAIAIENAQERNLLRTLIDNLPDCIYIKDTKSRFVLSNTATARLVGKTKPDEILGKTDFDFFPAELAERYRADEQGVMRSGQPLVNLEEPVMDHAGNQLWFLTTKVPLQDIHGKIVGLIGLNRYITERKQAEEALRKAYEELDYLAKRETDRAAVLQKLHQIGEQLLSAELSTRGLRRVLRQVARSARSVLGADLVDVYQYVEAEDRYILPPILEGRRLAPKVVKEQIFEDDVAVKVVSSGKPLYTPDAQTDRLLSGPFTVERPERPEERFVMREEVLSSAAVPLRAAGETVGVMFVNYRTRQDLTPDQREVIELLANQAAIAIYNARVLEEATSRAAVLQRLHQIGGQLLSVELTARGLRRVLRRVTRSAKSVLGADLVDVYQYIEAENRHIIPPILAGKRRDPTVPKDQIFQDDVVARVIQGREPRYSTAAQNDPLLTGPFTVERPNRPDERFVVREGVLSSAAVPLKAAGETVGVMFVNYRTRQDFTPDQREAIELFANQAAMAIYNARVYEQVQARIKALEALNTVSQRLSTGEATRRGLSRLLQQIARQAKKVLGADLVELYRYAPGRRERVASHVSAGKKLVAIKPSKKVLPDDVAAKVLTLSDPLFAVDAQHESLLSDPFKTDREGMPDLRFVAREQIASTAASPLMVGDEAVGILFVNYRTPQRFPADQRELIQLFASQAAVAIRNAQLFQQRETLEHIARDITSVLDRDKLLQRTLERSLKLLNCEFGSISIFDRRTNRLRFRYAVGKSPDMSVKLGEGLIGTTAKTRTPVRVADVSKDDRYVCHVEETQSELDVPMLVGRRLIGVLNAESRRPNAFSEEDQHLAEALAAQAAVAFRTAELYEEAQARLQERVDDIRAIQEISALIGTASPKDLLEQIAEQAARLTPAKYTGVWLLDERTHELRFGAMNRIEEKPVRSGPRLPLDETSISGHVAMTGKTYACDDVRDDPYYQEWYEEVRSELTTPLVYGERVIGTLDLESTEIGAFTEDHVHLVEALARAAAVAIQSARLYEQLNTLATRNARLYEAMQTVNEVGQVLTSGIRLQEQEVLELIHNQASKLMDTGNMYIALYDELTDTVRFGLAFVDGGRVDVVTEEGWQPRRAGKGKTEEIIRTRQPIFQATRAEAEAWYAEPGHEEYVGAMLPSWLGVPMMVGERVLGVIATYHPTRNYVYSKDDLAALQTMANQAAIALDNAYMFYDVNQRLAALVEFGQVITSGIRLHEDEVLELIYDQASKLMDTGNMYVALYDEETDIVRFGLAFVDGRRVDVETERGWQPRRAGKGKTEEIIRTRQPILHATRAEAEAWYAKPGHEEYIGAVLASWLGVPMTVGKKVLGVIAVYHPERDYVYSGDDLEVLQAMANQAAVALENATLYAQAREEAVAARQLATLGTAAAALQHRINNTLNIILPNIRRLRRRVNLSDETIREILDIIERNARYSSQAVGRIMEPLKDSTIQKVNINALIEDVAHELEEQHRTKRAKKDIEEIAVKLDLEDPLPEIWAASGHISEVFRTLIENSFNAMAEISGQITVTSRYQEEEIIVEVQDTGPGIPANVVNKLFHRPVPSDKPGGSAGLGLWLAGLLLQRYRGYVTIGATGPSGTIMRVCIPT